MPAGGAGVPMGGAKAQSGGAAGDAVDPDGGTMECAADRAGPGSQTKHAPGVEESEVGPRRV